MLQNNVSVLVPLAGKASKSTCPEQFFLLFYLLQMFKINYLPDLGVTEYNSHSNLTLEGDAENSCNVTQTK